MRYKRLAHISICFVVLIFISQTLLMYKLLQINKAFLARELNLISQEAYTLDMNLRYNMGGKKSLPELFIGDNNMDEMSAINEGSSVALINIAMEIFLSKKYPIQLQTIDSIASALFKKNGFNAVLYSRIIDIENHKVLVSTQKGRTSSSSYLILSKSIPLNFRQTKVLQVGLLNPMKKIVSQMTVTLLISLLISLFCIYCLYVLQRTLSRQKKLTQSKNDFYNQVSHELKRPISVIYKALDSLLNTRAIDNPKKREKYLEISIDELKRMNGKIDMILTMSMEEEGMFRLSLSEFNLTELIQELKDLYLGLSPEQISITVNNLLDKPCITADRDHLYQCLSNLLDNAIKYSGDSVDILMELSDKKGWVFISVQDNGTGIKEEDLDKIFEKFARVDTDRKKHGYGIGLSYVKQIIEKHGGYVSVRSEPAKGSKFTIQLPDRQILPKI